LEERPGTPIAILYLDSKDENAFGAEQPPGYSLTPMLEGLRQAAYDSGMASDLADLGRELRKRGPGVRLYDSPGGG